MAELIHVHHETVNHREDCYEKKYELANPGSAGELAGLAQAAMRRATKNERIVVLADAEAPGTIVLRLPLDMKREQINRLQDRMADYIKKSTLA